MNRYELTDHSLPKYETTLPKPENHEVLFSAFFSSTFRLYKWQVPLSETTEIKVESLLKARQYIQALSAPLQTSLSLVRSFVLHILMRVPLSLAVATQLESSFRAIAVMLLL